VLGNLADGIAANRAAVVEAGTIPALVELLISSKRTGHLAPGTCLAAASDALCAHAHSKDANYKPAAMAAAAEMIPLLVALLRGGSDEGKAGAAEVLMRLVRGNKANMAAIVEACAWRC
jgi:hypothetical protein